MLSGVLTPIQQFQSSVGKGNTDSSMIIDAMDILQRHKDIDVFCIVSSDADFTRLAAKLREEGKMVMGIGSSLTPTPFIVACHRFVYLNDVDKYKPGSSSSSSGPSPPSSNPTSSYQKYSFKSEGSSSFGATTLLPQIKISPTNIAPTAPSSTTTFSNGQIMQSPSLALPVVTPLSNAMKIFVTTHSPPTAAAAALAPQQTKPPLVANPTSTSTATTQPPKQPSSQQKLQVAKTPSTPTLPQKPSSTGSRIFPAATATPLTNEDGKPPATTASTKISFVGEGTVHSFLQIATRAWLAYRSDEGWAPVLGMEREILKFKPDFAVAIYEKGKYASFEELLRATGFFEFKPYTFKPKEALAEISILHARRRIERVVEAPPSSGAKVAADHIDENDVYRQMKRASDGSSVVKDIPVSDSPTSEKEAFISEQPKADGDAKEALTVEGEAAAVVEPVTMEVPSSANSTVVDSVAVEPILADPAVADSIRVEPTLVDPALVDLVTVEPTLVDPAVTDLVTVEPTLVDPAVVDSIAMDEPAATRENIATEETLSITAMEETPVEVVAETTQNEKLESDNAATTLPSKE